MLCVVLPPQRSSIALTAVSPRYVMCRNPLSGEKRLPHFGLWHLYTCTLQCSFSLTNEVPSLFDRQNRHLIGGVFIALPSRLALRRRRYPRHGAAGGGFASYGFFIAAMCLHALPVCANPLHSQYRLPSTCAIRYHFLSLDSDFASYSYSPVLLTAISLRFDL